MHLYIGTSGYYFKHWKKRFYKTNKFLNEYSQYFNSVEINNTFYRLPSKTSVGYWQEYNFKYSFKISRYFRSFIKNDVPKARTSWKMQYKSLGTLAKKSTFILQFDSNTVASIKLINNIRKCITRKIKLVIEGRHESWTSDLILQKLTKEKIPLVVLPENAIFNMDFMKVLKYSIKTKIVYIRFHGLKKYGKKYSLKYLKYWANIIKKLLKRNIEVYCYFNNDEKAYAPINALELKSYV